MFLSKDIQISITTEINGSIKSSTLGTKHAAFIMVFLTKSKLEFCYHQINLILKDFYSGGDQF